MNTTNNTDFSLTFRKVENYFKKFKSSKSNFVALDVQSVKDTLEKVRQHINDNDDWKNLGICDTKAIDYFESFINKTIFESTDVQAITDDIISLIDICDYINSVYKKNYSQDCVWNKYSTFFNYFLSDIDKNDGWVCEEENILDWHSYAKKVKEDIFYE